MKLKKAFHQALKEDLPEGASFLASERVFTLTEARERRFLRGVYEAILPTYCAGTCKLYFNEFFVEDYAFYFTTEEEAVQEAQKLRNRFKTLEDPHD